MRKYEVIYCFEKVHKNQNIIERDKNGKELFYREVIEAYNGAEAIEKFKAMEQFKNVKPEIWEVRVKGE